MPLNATEMTLFHNHIATAPMAWNATVNAPLIWFQYFETTLMSRPSGPRMNGRIIRQLSRMKPTTLPKASPIQANTGLRKSHTACTEALIMFHAAVQIFWPNSVLVKNHTRPATNAPIATMIQVIGLVASASAPAKIPDATAPASMATRCAARAIRLPCRPAVLRPVAAKNTPCATLAIAMTAL